jgi:ABC-type transporter Mla maintaining outer membrane lipid asymmetry ATPase subunit MlaF
MSAANPVSLVEMEGVDVVHESAPDTVLVGDVRWRICAGEFWVVSGEQGIGKSSLLATAAGLNRPAGGTLRIMGRDLREADEQEQVRWRCRIGYVFDRGGRLFSHLTVAENIALAFQYHTDASDEETMARVEELLRQADLMKYATDLPSRLNERIQQRTALVRALAVPKDMLMVDNPLAGLTVRRSEWWQVFLQEQYEQRRASDKPLTVVVTTDVAADWRGTDMKFAVIADKGFHVLDERGAR